MASVSIPGPTHTDSSTGALPSGDLDALRAFVASASTDEIVDRLVRTERRLQELDERLRIVKRLVDDAEL